MKPGQSRKGAADSAAVVVVAEAAVVLAVAAAADNGENPAGNLLRSARAGSAEAARADSTLAGAL